MHALGTAALIAGLVEPVLELFVGFVLLVALVALLLVGVRFQGRADPGGLAPGDELTRPDPHLSGNRHRGRSDWLARRTDATNARGLLLSVVVVAAALCTLVFVGLLQDVLRHQGAVRFDPGITRFLVEHRTERLNTVIRSITWLGSNSALIPLTVALVIFVGVIRRNVWGALLAALALGGADLLYNVIKPLVERPRPPVALHLVEVSSFSFPSGHATAVTACFGMGAALLAAHRPLRFKVLAAVAAAIVIVLVGFSRIYLGVHWFTDVVAGVSLGGLWLCVLWTIAILVGVPRGSVPARTRDPGRPAVDRPAERRH